MAIQIDETELGLDPEKVENGVYMEVLDANDEPTFLGGDKTKPKRVLVRSNRSEPVKALGLKLQKRTSAMNRGRRRQDASIPNDEFIGRQAAACVAELQNFHPNHPSQKPTEDEVYALFKNVTFESLRDDIWNFSKDDGNYMMTVGEDAPTGKEKADGGAKPDPSNSAAT